MTVLSFFAKSKDELPPTFIDAERLVKARRTPLMAGVGEIPSPLSDEAREELIAGYGRLMEECVSKAHGPLRAFWLIEAQGWKERMHALIAQRSPEYVRSLEIKRGLI
ncbi:MAG: hypothetical protein ACLGIW_18460 [Gammaproteobacteria bacterium]